MDLITCLLSSYSKELSDKIKQHEPVFEQLVKQGQNLVESTEPGAEREELENKLSDVKARWDEVKQKAADHMDLVNSTVPEAEKYQEAADSLGPWLPEAENALASLEPVAADEDSIAARKAAVKALRDDIEQHRADRDAVGEKSGAVTALAQADQETVEKQAQELTERYDNLDASCAAKEEELENVLNALEQYRVTRQPVDQMLDKAEAVLASLGPVSGDVDKNKEELDKLKVG